MFLVQHAWDTGKGCHLPAVAPSPEQDLNRKALQDVAPLAFICYDMEFDSGYTVLKLQAKAAEPIVHNTTTGAVWGKSEPWQPEGCRGQLGFAGRMMLQSVRPGSSAFPHHPPRI